VWDALSKNDRTIKNLYSRLIAEENRNTKSSESNHTSNAFQATSTKSVHCATCTCSKSSQLVQLTTCVATCRSFPITSNLKLPDMFASVIVFFVLLVPEGLLSRRGTSECTLLDVLYTPDLGSNLMSLGRLTKAKLIYQGNSSGLRIFHRDKPNVTVMRAFFTRNNLLILDFINNLNLDISSLA
jgi:hypothetical protein